MSHQANGKVPGGGTEPELVARARAGDPEAFAALYTQHYTQVRIFLYNRTKSRHLADDLTQDVFVRALAKLDTFQPRASGAGFVGWLMVIARNLVADYFKSSLVRLEVPVGEMVDADVLDRSAESSVLRALDIAEARETVATAMQSLSARHRRCVELRFMEELPLAETAARLGKGVPATKMIQLRATRAMRAAITTSAVAA
ncbi:RNA polymerase sigma factor [Streptomyces sp. NPDC059477]|uniref:RNA polymerase sigma factor n=1 Tax=Streptomyces sp. NPDC059477 TaxID=3346847 RepID=UPI00368CA5F9